MTNCCQFGQCLDSNKLKDKLQPHENAIKNVQAMLMFRAVIPYVVLLVVVELTLVIVHCLHLEFIATVMLLCVYNLVFQLVYEFYGEKLSEKLMKYDAGKDGECNRVRSVHEIVDSASPFLEGLKKVCEFLCCDKDGEKNIVKTFVIPIVASIVGFLIFLGIGTFWPVAVLLNIALILPGVILHPEVQKLLNKSKAQDKPQEKAEEKPHEE